MAKLLKITRKWNTQEVILQLSCSPVFVEFYKTIPDEQAQELVNIIDRSLDVFVKEVMEIVKERNAKRHVLQVPKEQIIVMK